MTVEIRNIVWMYPENHPGNNCSMEMIRVKHNDIEFHILDQLLKNYGVPVSFDWCTRNSHRAHHWDLNRRVTGRLDRDS